MSERFEVDSLVVVAQSQRTITAIDVLGEKEESTQECPMAATLVRYRNKDLVTTGSPFNHVYQHYFPHEYGALEHSDYEELFRQADCLLTLFRIDD